MTTSTHETNSCVAQQPRCTTQEKGNTSHITSQLTRPAFAVPRSRHQSTTAVLMPDMRASAEAFTLKKEKDHAMAQQQTTPDTVEVSDAAFPYRTGNRLPFPLSGQVVDVESYEGSKKQESCEDSARLTKTSV